MVTSSVPRRPRPAGSSPRLRRLAASVGVAALGLATVAGCSDSDAEDAGPATLIEETVVTSEPATTVAPPSGSTSAPTTTGAQPSSPSSLPADLAGTCAPLAETYGIADLQPQDSESWPDERQRVVVDGRREADLLNAAAAGAAPAPIAADIATLAAYATFVADAVEPAEDFVAARAALDAGPPTGPVLASADAVTAWRGANC